MLAMDYEFIEIMETVLLTCSLFLEINTIVYLRVYCNIVPFRLQNRWCNCFHYGIHAMCSHTYRKCNCCADKFVNHERSIIDVVWFSTMPHFLDADFYWNRNGLPNFRFP